MDKEELQAILEQARQDEGSLWRATSRSSFVYFFQK